LNGIQEVEGSTPLSSTTRKYKPVTPELFSGVTGFAYCQRIASFLVCQCRRNFDHPAFRNLERFMVFLALEFWLEKGAALRYFFYYISTENPVDDMDLQD
jgi:hypothetical protein